MTFTNNWARNYGRFTIQRVREYEIDEAILGLTERGYELIQRGKEERDVKSYNPPSDKFDRLAFSGSNSIKKYWAVMQKVEVKV